MATPTPTPAPTPTPTLTSVIPWRLGNCSMFSFPGIGHVLYGVEGNGVEFGFLPVGAAEAQPVSMETPATFAIFDCAVYAGGRGDRLAYTSYDRTGVGLATLDRSGQTAKIVDNGVRLGPLAPSGECHVLNNALGVSPDFSRLATANMVSWDTQHCVHIFPADAATANGATFGLPHYRQTEDAVVDVKWHTDDTLFTMHESRSLVLWDVRSPVASTRTVFASESFAPPLLTFVPYGDAIFVSSCDLILTVDPRMPSKVLFTTAATDVPDIDLFVISASGRTLFTRGVGTGNCFLWEHDAGTGLRLAHTLVRHHGDAHVFDASFDSDDGSLLMSLWGGRGIERYACDGLPVGLGLPFEGPERD